MGFTLKTHTYSRVQGTSDLRLTSYDPYLRLSKDGQALFVQKGRVYTESGKHVKEVPGWFLEAAKSVSPKTAQEVDLTAVTEPQPEKKSSPPKPASMPKRGPDLPPLKSSEDAS